MAELTQVIYAPGGITEDFIITMSSAWSWKKIEINDDRTQIDLYISDIMYFRFENNEVTSSSDSDIVIKWSVYKGETELFSNVSSSPLYSYTRVEMVKTSNSVMLEVHYSQTTASASASNGTGKGRWIATTAKNAVTDVEQPAMIYVTNFSKTYSSNKAQIYTDDIAISVDKEYTLSLFGSQVSSVAPLTTPDTPYVSKYVYTVHSSQLGGVDLHAPVLINNVNYYLYGTLAFRE